MINLKEFEVIKYLVLHSDLSLKKDFYEEIADKIYCNTHFKLFDSVTEIAQIISNLKCRGYILEDGVSDSARMELLSCRVDNAIILAAGGSDISAKSVYSMPKGLYVKNGETLIERQIRQLKEVGISDISVVVGYKQEMYFFLEEKWGVKLVINPDLKKNNIFSLYSAMDALGSTYICNCDNYFSENPFSPYEYHSYHATVYKDMAQNELLVKKNDFGRLVGVFSGPNSGECLYGHAYLSSDFSRIFQKYLQLEIDNFRTSVLFWEEFVSNHIENLDMYVREYSAEFIHEFDSIQELQNIDSLFLENVSGKINEKICSVLNCCEADIGNVEISQKGLTNVLFTFVVNNQKYIFRYPGESSSNIVYRLKEVTAQKLAAEAGVDNTYVYIDDSGVKISKFVDGCKNLQDIYYKDVEFMKELARKIRLFHNAGSDIPDCELYFNNPIEESDRLMKDASRMKGNLFEMFRKDRENVIRIFNYAESDGIQKTMCHNDINGDNCLLTDASFDVIDWEFAGYNDPAYDFGRVIAEYDFDSPAIDEILEAYFERPPTYVERLHWIAYVGIHNWYYFNWALYKESINESSRDWMLFFYKKVKKVIEYVIPRYEAIYG